MGYAIHWTVLNVTENMNGKLIAQTLGEADFDVAVPTCTYNWFQRFFGTTCYLLGRK